MARIYEGQLGDKLAFSFALAMDGQRPSENSTSATPRKAAIAGIVWAAPVYFVDSM
jgi:hypothetical protein